MEVFSVFIFTAALLQYKDQTISSWYSETELLFLTTYLAMMPSLEAKKNCMYICSLFEKHTVLEYISKTEVNGYGTG